MQLLWTSHGNLSPSGQKLPPFRTQYFRYIFLDEKFCIFIKISLIFVPIGPIDNNPALV